MLKKRKKKNDTLQPSSNFTLADNVISILIWGIYVVSAMMILEVSGKGISIVMAGLATGLGFAMKDLLENFIYGVTLMTGRLRVGDYIECDGVQGKVDSINYQSTQLVTLDGSVIAFQNAASSPRISRTLPATMVTCWSRFLWVWRMAQMWKKSVRC